MEEQWRIIGGTDGLYQVSDLGRIACTRKGKFKLLVFHANPKGYLYYHENTEVKLLKSVARTVAKAFPEICGEWFEGCEVDHINTDRSDNRAVNLRVVSHRDNCRNPLTIAKRRKNMSDEEWEEYQKERKRYFKKIDRQNNKEYYRNYMKKYTSTEKYKEAQRIYHKKRNANLTEEQKEKNRERALKYYYEHRDEIKAKQKEKYEAKKQERWAF